MAVSQEQKVDFLLKKLGFTKTKTGLAVDSSLTGTKKAGFAEAIPSPLIVPNDSLWIEAGSIPATPPSSDTNQVRVYLASGSGLRMTVDTTVAGNRAFIAFETYNDTTSNRLNNWIDTQFGASYLIKVFKGDPNSGGVQLSAAGSGANDGWFFDYSAGILNFNDTNVPSGVATDNIYIVGYRYIGQTGAPTPGISTFSFKDLSIERNLDVGIQGGISTFRNNIDLNGDLDVDGHTNLDNVSIAGVTTFAENIDANGDLDVDGHTNLDNVSVAGVSTFVGRIFVGGGASGAVTGGIKVGNNLLIQDQVNVSLSHQSNASIYLKAVNLELRNQNNHRFLAAGSAVGNGVGLYHFDGSSSTEKFRVTSSGVTVYGTAVATGADINGDLDVDGHTNLDNVSIAGVTSVASLTSGRVVLAGTNGKLEDSNNLTFNGSTLAVTGGASFSGNVSIGGTLTYEDVKNVDAVGLITARSGIRVTGGVIEAQAGENKIPALYSNLAALPSPVTYHGMFAHVHSTGRGYFSHAGGWYELVNKETNGTVGTGTERYNIGPVDLTTLDVSGISTFAGNIDANGDLDVDGHTNLDNVSIAGVTTTAGLLDINAGGQANTFKVEDLTSGRVVLAGTGGELEDSNNLTFDGTNLFVSGINVTGGGGTSILGADIVTRNLKATGITTLVTTDINGDLDVDGHTNLDNVSIAGVTTFAGNIDANVDLDVDGHTNLDNVSVAGVSTFSDNVNIDANGDLDVDGHTNLDNVSISGITTFTNSAGDVSFKPIQLEKSATTGVTRIQFLENGTNKGGISYSHDNNRIEIQTESNGKVRFNDVTNSQFALLDGSGLTVNGASGITALAADINGDLDVDGHTNLDNVNIVGVTTHEGHVLPSADSTYDLGSSSKYWRNVYADNVTGGGGGVIIGDDIITRNLKVNGISTFIGIATFNNATFHGDIDVDGHTNLDNVSVAGVTTFAGVVEFDNKAKFDSTIAVHDGTTGSNGQYLLSTGVGVTWGSFPTMRTSQTFTASAGQTTFSFTYNVGFLDVYVNGVKLSSSEFTANNGTSVVLAVGSFVGDIVELISFFTTSYAAGTSGLGNIVEDTTPQLGGNLDLFNKSITGTGNINITGIITATTFVGDGSGLTGVIGSGSGVVIKDSGSTVGTAGTINFGNNLSVSAISGGSVTITATGGGGGTSGINTIGGVVNIVNDLDVDGTSNLDNVDIVGITTIRNVSGTKLYEGSGNGSKLFHAGTERLSTETYGIDINGELQSDALDVDGNGDISGNLVIGGDIDVDGHTELDNVNVAGVVTTSDIRSNTLNFKNAGGGATYAVFTNGGSVLLKHNNTDRLETSASGVTVTGTVAATAFSGDGSGLTGITGSGSGVVVKDNGSTVGTAGTINFGETIDVSAISGGSVTVGVSTSQFNVDKLNVSGISTFVGVTTFKDDIFLPETKSINIGNGTGIFSQIGGLVIENGFITNSGGVLNITSVSGDIRSYSSDNFSVFTNNNEQAILATKNGSVALYHDGGNKKIETSATGVTVTGTVTATAFVGDGSNLTGISGGGGTNVGITTNLSGSFTANAGSPSTINTYGYSSNDRVVEYTILIEQGANFQSQKVLAMRSGTTVHSTQFAVMFSSSLLVQCDVIISGGNMLLRATPETGISGSTGYKIKREVM